MLRDWMSAESVSLCAWTSTCGGRARRSSHITDDTRIRESCQPQLPRETRGEDDLMAHFGRPKGKPVPQYRSSVAVIAYAHQPTGCVSHDTIGKSPEEIIAHMQPGM